MKTTTTKRDLHYWRHAKAAGCARDQWCNFDAAGYTAQPKQLLFHAACRLCDQPDGPTQIGFGDDPYDALRCGLLACPGARTVNHVAERLESWRG